ncbi:MAG: type II secretion system protein [Candidatus Paceibacterota bacterium]|jgi:prepilin-type N-terminal cleavage/methylation domain-containing protein
MKNNILKIRNCKLKIGDFRRGMTYVELIVVLGIFAVMSAIVMFSYGEFQAKVDIKNLASDIASKIVEAQKSAMSGNLPSTSTFCDGCKPSYGVYFNLANPTHTTNFIYFADFNNSGIYDDGEMLGDPFSITKNNYIYQIEECRGDCIDTNSFNLFGNYSITFKRPNSGAVFYLENEVRGPDPTAYNFSYVQITIKSPKEASAKIKIYPSGRIQVN